MSVIAPVHASSVPSVHLSDDEHQEILDEFPGTNYGEKNPSKITLKIPDYVTLTLHNAKFLVITPGNSNGIKYLVEFLPGCKWVKFTKINLQNYGLGVFHVTPHTMRCAH